MPTLHFQSVDPYWKKQIKKDKLLTAEQKKALIREARWECFKNNLGEIVGYIICTIGALALVGLIWLIMQAFKG